MRVAFFGTPQVAVVSLEALHRAGHELALVITQPDRPVGRSRTPAAPPVKTAALALGLTVRQPETLKGDTVSAELLALAPDVLVVVAYGRLLPGRILDAAARGAVNVHFSLLPLYRGAAPVQWALVRGETVTGVTTMQIVRRLDAGDILLQRELPIEPGEHAPTLQARLAVAGAELLISTLERLAAGTLVPRAQDESRATHAPPLTPADGVIDARLSALEIEGRVRGLDPWPGAWITLGGRRLRIVEARAIPGRPAGGAAAGTLVALREGGFALSCAADTLLQLVRVQPDGRREMPIEAAVNGRYVSL